MNQVQHRQPHSDQVVLLDLLNQAFPGQIDEIQAAPMGSSRCLPAKLAATPSDERFDRARLTQVRAARQGEARQAVTSLDDVDKARRALQQAILHLGISLIQYAVGGGHEEGG